MEFGRLREVEDFDYGALPDDDENGEGEEIDAINDETFGADVATVHASDLGDYAAQTASLRLEDWDQPGCSNEQAPDASQVPLPVFPSFGFNMDSPLFAPTFNSLDKIPSMWDSSSNGLFNMWGDTTKRDEYDRLKESFDALDTYEDLFPSASAVRKNFLVPQAGPALSSLNWKQPKKSMAPGTTSYAIRILQRPKEENLPLALPKVPALPPGALSAEELERSLINQSAQKQQNIDGAPMGNIAKALAQIQDHQKMSGQSPAPRPSDKSMPPPQMQHPRGPYQMPPGMMNRPPMPPQLPPMLMRFVPVWMEFLSGKIPYLPPGVPPVPPPVGHFFQQMRQMGPPPMMGPPNNMGFHGPRPPLHSPALSQMSDIRKPSNRRVAPGMPSGKTIEDFAFEPFAGFMSCKEREWLVKIQILQCQGQGDPYEDDFYYASWRDKQLAAGWRPSPKKEEQLTEREERGKKYRERKDSERERVRDSDRQSSNGTPRDRDEREKKETTRVPFFAGSLGKPVSSTVYNPRHLIDVSKEEGAEDEKKSAAQAAATQKKLRTMLLRLESAAAHLIHCREKRRLAFTLPTQEREILENEVGTALQLVYRELFSPEHFTKTLQISKGRLIFKKFIEASPPNVRDILITSLFDAIPTYSKRTYNDLTADLCPIVDMFLASQKSRDHLIFLVNRLDASKIQTAVNEKNTFARDLLCTLLLWCSRQKAASNHELFLWLRSKESVSWDGQGWTHLLKTWSSTLHLSTVDLQDMKNWLSYLSLDPRAQTVASSLAESLSNIQL
ncbi:unnamed protein product, partial [Mesorhabditis belari]|uniref:Uncharacterized protein n=1 Tax=Mesorhabditis belari TaxID=2138241 RepID=A0AAF3EF30_9BILA